MLPELSVLVCLNALSVSAFAGEYLIELAIPP
jgi:hypothetical protein